MRLPVRTLALVVTTMLTGTACSGSPTTAPSTSPTTVQLHEAMLYELGAFPVAKLTQLYWDNGYPGKVYGKGERIDVDGWLPPFWAASSDYLTDAEKAKYGIPKKPLTYKRYLEMLDIDSYQRTPDPMRLLVMRFALERMAAERQDVQKEDMLRVYEAGIGLEPFVLPLLNGRLTGDDVMRLVGNHGDEKLLGILPPPQPQDRAYIAFLNEQASAAKWSIHARQECYELLWALEPQAYRQPYGNFLLVNVKNAEDWWERAGLYEALIRLKNEQSLQAVREGLVHDPVTECRESILRELQEQGEVAGVIDAILMVANRQDTEHHAHMPSRGSDQWSYSLGEYLKWAKSQKALDAATLQKVDEAIGKLKDLHK